MSGTCQALFQTQGQTVSKQTPSLPSQSPQGSGRRLGEETVAGGGGDSAGGGHGGGEMKQDLKCILDLELTGTNNLVLTATEKQDTQTAAGFRSQVDTVFAKHKSKERGPERPHTCTDGTSGKDRRTQRDALSWKRRFPCCSPGTHSSERWMQKPGSNAFE